MPFRRVALPSCLATAVLAGGWLIPSASDAAGPASHQPIVIDAASSHVDYKTDTVVFRNVVVSQDDTRISAERAHAAGVSFTNSRWTFEGDVRITLEPRGTLRADQAVVQFRDNRIAEATAIGKPASFELQRTPSRQAVRGDADRIEYTAKNDSVRLSGGARLSDGRNAEISGPVLVYDIRNEQLQAASSGERRGVHITVTPQSLRKKGKAPAGKPPGR
jgi:lipopolysaccharide export system protein LptA